MYHQILKWFIGTLFEAWWSKLISTKFSKKSFLEDSFFIAPRKCLLTIMIFFFYFLMIFLKTISWIDILYINQLKTSIVLCRINSSSYRITIKLLKEHWVPVFKKKLSIKGGLVSKYWQTDLNNQTQRWSLLFMSDLKKR